MVTHLEVADTLTFAGHKPPLPLIGLTFKGGSSSPSPHLPEDVLSSFLSLVDTGNAVMELLLLALAISIAGPLVVARSSSSCT